MSPCPGARELVRKLKEAGKKVIFVTNNSAKGPEDLCRKFAQLDFPTISPAEVMTAATAASLYITQQQLGGKVYAVGMPGLAKELRCHGLEVKTRFEFCISHLAFRILHFAFCILQFAFCILHFAFLISFRWWVRRIARWTAWVLVTSM